MYDYGGLRTRVNPLTDEIEYDDTPEPVAEPVSEPKAAPLRPVMPSAEYHEPDPNAGAPPVAMMPRTAQPRYAPQPSSAAIQPVEPPVPGGGAPPIVPKISPTMSTAEVADPHAMAELQADPVAKRNLFSKILAGLAGASYGSQGRLDLAEQVGQAPRLAHERQVKEIEGRIRQGNNDLQERRDRELRQRIANAQITADEARTNELLHPHLDPRISIDERGGTEYDPNTHQFKFTPNPNYHEKPHYQLVPNAQGGYDRIDPDTGERAPVEGSSRPAPKPDMTERGFRAEAHRRGIVEGSPEWNKAWAAAGFKPVKPADTGAGRPESSWYQANRAEVDAAAQAAAESDGANWAELSPLQRSMYIEKTARAMGQDALAPRPK